MSTLRKESFRVNSAYLAQNSSQSNERNYDMTLKTLAFILGTSMLLSCSVYAGDRNGHYDRHHDGHHKKHHRHHDRSHRRHDRSHGDWRRGCRHYSHYRAAGYSRGHGAPRIELGFRYGYPVTDAVIVYQPSARRDHGY
jgi:hypothetical protein